MTIGFPLLHKQYLSQSLCCKSVARLGLSCAGHVPLQFLGSFHSYFTSISEADENAGTARKRQLINKIPEILKLFYLIIIILLGTYVQAIKENLEVLAYLHEEKSIAVLSVNSLNE